MRNRLSAVCVLVLPATASLARRLRLAPRESPQAVAVLTARPADLLRKASPAAPRKLFRPHPLPAVASLARRTSPRPGVEISSALDVKQVLGLKISARRFGRIASWLRL